MYMINEPNSLTCTVYIYIIYSLYKQYSSGTLNMVGMVSLGRGVAQGNIPFTSIGGSLVGHVYVA